MSQNSDNKSLRDFRVERFEEIGFTHKEASELADSKDDLGFDLGHRKVKRALDKGCSHKMAMRIFAD